MHEIDEILGIGGTGSALGFPQGELPSDWYGALDLYRYCAPGDPTFSYDPSACVGLNSTDEAYFSIDGGVTAIDTFNQQYQAYGDAGDWGLDFSQLCPGGTGFGGSGHVQDAFSCNNQQHDFTYGSPEFTALESIGYDPVPEPWTLALFGAGLLGLGALYRRRKIGA